MTGYSVLVLVYEVGHGGSDSMKRFDGILPS